MTGMREAFHCVCVWYPGGACAAPASFRGWDGLREGKGREGIEMRWSTELAVRVDSMVGKGWVGGVGLG
jgi:hypothetical protein